MNISIAQIQPEWLDKKATLSKIENYIERASLEKSHLIVFGETVLPGYPFWVELTD